MSSVLAVPTGSDARIVVFGASGGIGHALVEEYIARMPSACIVGAARSAGPRFSRDVQILRCDVTDEESIGETAEAIRRQLGSVDIVVVATGVLHGLGGARPEKAARELDPAKMLAMFSTNTVGPALVLKHMMPLMARDRRTVFAALSAKVGSIADNALGGWYSYRASKAALNMVVKTGSIEFTRTHPQAICVSLHPGTVATRLSQPFERPGRVGKVFAPDRAARQLVDVIEKLRPDDSGHLFDWKGERIPF